MHPNVLMVVFDAARRDALEPYGAAAGASPALAQLAQRGKAHERVYATAPWTVPSHASFFTGLMPRAAGMSRAQSPVDVNVAIGPHRNRLLPSVMREAGYSTAAASANLWLSKPTGFDAGFDDFVEIDTNRNAQIHLDSPREKLHWYLEAVRAKADDGAGQVEDAMLGWAARDQQPFFWFINLLECHSPYLPPLPYGGRAPIARFKAAGDARRHYTLEGFWRACAGVEEVPQATLERARRFYAASIRYMDDWLGRMLEALDDRGVLDETLVIVLADHGENFGELGLIGHGLSLDNRLIHVPFVAAGPGSEALELTSLVDLPAALAEACGLEAHPWTSRAPAGVGLGQFDPPVMAGETEHIESLRSMGIDGAALEKFLTPLTCAVDGELKLLRRGTEEVLFDLEADPGEAHPQPLDPEAADRDARVSRLREAIEFGGQPVGSATTPSPDSGPSEEEVRDLEERMKLLGYM